MTWVIKLKQQKLKKNYYNNIYHLIAQINIKDDQIRIENKLTWSKLQ